MLNYRPQADWPMLRVRPQEEVPGFRVNDTGSVRSNLNDPSMPSGSFSPYADSSVGVAPLVDFLSGFPARDLPGIESRPVPQQAAAAVSCSEGHRACRAAGRPDTDCLRLLWQCSQNGVPAIFAPGIWGKRV